MSSTLRYIERAKALARELGTNPTPGYSTAPQRYSAKLTKVRGRPPRRNPSSGGSDGAPAMVASGPAIVDSGTAVHLASERKCTQQELQKATPTNIVLVTAAGEEHADKQIEMELDGLDVTVDAVVLPDTPVAISLGRLVIEKGFKFFWDPEDPFRPWLEAPDGTRTYLDVKGVCSLPAASYRGGAAEGSAACCHSGVLRAGRSRQPRRQQQQ